MVRGTDQTNLDLGVFQDTKVMDGIHTRASAVYHVFATNRAKPAPRGGRGGSSSTGLTPISRSTSSYFVIALYVLSHQRPIMDRKTPAVSMP